MPAGRPTKYTPKLGDRICAKIAGGVSLVKISTLKTMPHRATVYNWRRQNIEFRDNYARAREDYADSVVDELIDIADAATVADVQVAKLRIDARKWTAARFNKAYKDKRDVDVNVSGYVDHSKMDSDQLDRRIAELQDQIEQSETD